MAPRKNGHSYRFEQKTQPADLKRMGDNEGLGTGKAGNEHEPKTNYEAEEYESDDFDVGELTDEDFAVDGEEEEEDI